MPGDEPLHHKLLQKIREPGWKTKVLDERWCSSPLAATLGVNDGTLEGNIYTDGSMLHSRPKSARRAGYALVTLHSSGKILNAIYGPHYCLEPTAYKAELFAVYRAIALATGPVVIHLDCKAVVSCFKYGKSHCTALCQAGADIWRDVFAIIDEMGQDWVQLVWCKGHARQIHLQAGLTTAIAMQGNDHADVLAKRGAEIATKMYPNDRQVELYQEAIDYYKWVRFFIKHWPEQCDFDKGALEGKKQRYSLPASKLDAQKPHRIWKVAAGYLCVRCGRKAGEKRLTQLKASPCHHFKPFCGTAASRVNSWWDRCCDSAILEKESELIQKGAKPTDMPVDIQHRQGIEGMPRKYRIRSKQPPTTIATGEKAEKRGVLLLGSAWRTQLSETHCFAASATAVFCLKCACFATSLSRARGLRKECVGHDPEAAWVKKLLVRLKAGRPPRRRRANPDNEQPPASDVIVLDGNGGQP